MSILHRVGQVISANAHELVDTWEDPRVMLRHALRQQEEQLSATLDRAAKVVACEKLLARQLEEQRRRASRCRDLAAEALRQQDETRARQWLSQRREAQQSAAALAHELARVESASQRLKARIGDMRLQLAEQRRQVLTLEARQRAAEAWRIIASRAGRPLSDRGLLKPFDRYLARIESLEAEAEAEVELYGPGEPADVFRCDEDRGIADELAELMIEIRQGEQAEP